MLFVGTSFQGFGEECPFVPEWLYQREEVLSPELTAFLFLGIECEPPPPPPLRRRWLQDERDEGHDEADQPPVPHQRRAVRQPPQPPPHLRSPAPLPIVRGLLSPGWCLAPGSKDAVPSLHRRRPALCRWRMPSNSQPTSLVACACVCKHG